MRVSVKAIIIRDGKLLTLACRDEDGQPFYILPGGGQEQGESLHDALKRECLEEIGVDVTPGPLVYVRDYFGLLEPQPDKSVQQVELMFRSTITAEVKAKMGSAPDACQEDVAWLPVDQLEEYCFYPLALRKVIDRTDQVVYQGTVE